MSLALFPNREQGKEEIVRKIEKENYWIGTQQRCYTDGTARGSIKNIGDNWKEIGTKGREKERKESTKKRKKKKSRKEVE